jgi:hypothetical protein
MDWCTIFGAVVYGLDFALLVLMYPFDSHSFFPSARYKHLLLVLLAFL